MEISPQVLVKKIELKLENSLEDAAKSIKSLLTAYKGVEIPFQRKNNGIATKFTIGTGANKNDASIYLTQNSSNSTIMILEVSSNNQTSMQEDPAKIIQKIDILTEDILLHIASSLIVKEKAKIEKGKICPNCKISNDLDSKFCKKCLFDFLEISPELPTDPQQPFKSLENSKETSQIKSKLLFDINQLDKKYPNKFECELCELKCAYKDPFILLLADMRNLEEYFKKFDEFLHTKDLDIFSDYIFNFSLEQLKKYSKFSTRELGNIAFCIFSILSWHILEKAPQKIRIIFAKKMKERLSARFNKEYPLNASNISAVSDSRTPLPPLKTGTLLIEENRCSFCYKKIDEKILNLKIKGYPVECPMCGHLL